MARLVFAPLLLPFALLAPACDDDPATGAPAGGDTADAGGGDGGGGGGGGSQSPPGEIALGPEQGLYVTDYAGALFHLSLEDGAVLGKYGTPGDGKDQYREPTGVAATKKHLFVADRGNRRIVRLTVASGAGWSVLTPDAPTDPYGVAAYLSEDEKEETLLFSDYDGMQFFTVPASFDAAPVKGASLDGFNACSVAIREDRALGTAGCSSGLALNIVVSASSGDRVYPPSAGTGELRRPDGIAFLPDGTLAIADTGNFRVLCVMGSSSGSFGKQGSEGDLELLSIAAVAADARGRIFVADPSRKRIVRVDDCDGTNPKVIYEGETITQITGLAAVGPYPGVQATP